MLCSKDFMKKCRYNLDTQNQLWCSVLADSHDSWCGCDLPFAHLLSSIFPPGHADRQLTIEQILQRDYKQLCHSGGDAAEKTGMADAGPSDAAIKEEGYIEDEELDQLIGLGESAAAEDTR